MRRVVFFIVAIVFATSSFASIPRVPLLDRASEDASTFAASLPETRIRVSDVLAPFEQPAPTLLNRALHQAYADVSTTNASGLGRFLSVDPTWESADLGSPQTWNRYAYVRNNPVNMTDPDGRNPLVLVLGGAGTTVASGGTALLVVGGVLVVGAISEIEVGDKTIGRHVGDFMLSGGGSSGEMAAERFAQNMSNHMAENANSSTKPALPKPPRGAGSAPPEDRDPKRKFSPQEREAKRDAQVGQCANGCGKTIDQSNSNGHHVVRHADGGKTGDKNHAEVCKDCHKELHSPPM